MGDEVDVGFSDLLTASGATQVEILGWLERRGVKTSIHSIKAWSRGTYRTPVDAMRAVMELVALVHDMEILLPDDTPAGSVRRRNAYVFAVTRIDSGTLKV